MGDLRMTVGPLELPNPVLVASGTFGYGQEYGEFMDPSQLGGIMVTGTTLKPRPGNPPPRLVETPAGILNSIGLQNPGIEVFLEEELPRLRSWGVPIIVNISGNTIEEYGQLAARLDGLVEAIEINVSCPNVAQGGLVFGTDPRQVRAVVGEVCAQTRLPVITKLSPNVGDIVAVAEAAMDGGSHALSLINTILAMDIDVDKKRPVFANTFAGLSGPAIFPIALRMVWEVYAALKVPIIAMGGITSAVDALKFILAGARAVAVGTGNFLDPSLSIKIKDGLEAYLDEHGLDNFSSLVGAAQGGGQNRC
jgi:dihydroorotate dehydrogenase (NAD+) catalytic subunit